MPKLVRPFHHEIARQRRAHMQFSGATAKHSHGRHRLLRRQRYAGSNAHGPGIFAQFLRTHAHRGRGIDEQVEGDLSRLLEFLDVELTDARRNLPVDKLHRIAGDIDTRLGELETATVEDGFVLAEAQAVGQLVDCHFELPGIDRIVAEFYLTFHVNQGRREFPPGLAAPCGRRRRLRR